MEFWCPKLLLWSFLSSGALLTGLNSSSLPTANITAKQLEDTTTPGPIGWPPYNGWSFPTVKPGDSSQLIVTPPSANTIPTLSADNGENLAVSEESGTRKPTLNLTLTFNQIRESFNNGSSKPSGLGGIAHLVTVIVPDAITPGSSNVTLLSEKRVANILKILGSVAFLNLSGIIDNSLELGTSTAVREIAFGVTNIVFCNPLITAFSSGRCHKKANNRHTVLNLDNSNFTK